MPLQYGSEDSTALPWPIPEDVGRDRVSTTWELSFERQVNAADLDSVLADFIGKASELSDAESVTLDSHRAQLKLLWTAYDGGSLSDTALLLQRLHETFHLKLLQGLRANTWPFLRESQA